MPSRYSLAVSATEVVDVLVAGTVAQAIVTVAGS